LPTLETLCAYALCVFTKALTGARMLWIGCAPAATPRVYYANHNSHGDFALIWACMPDDLRERTRPVAGSDYWLKGKLRAFIAQRVIRAVLIDRNPQTRTEDPIGQMADVIDKGDSLIVFPEGTRSPDGKIHEFKSGLHHLARARPDLPLVPIYLQDLNRILPKGDFLPVPLLGSLSLGHPIKLEPAESKIAFLQRARLAVESLAK
jgi:1-acyl-sn-glycerol-3-phosphate acyltransferase